jgi:hypothetical protein
MSLPDFLHSLLQEGRTRVGPIYDQEGRFLAEAPDELLEVQVQLEEYEREYRSDLPHTPPEISPAAMLWAAMMVHRACSVLIYRDVNADQIQAALSVPCPEPATPQVVYSVDLTFRFLPDLMRMARAASPDDPLVTALGRWASEWPLSSVGITAIQDLHAPTFLDHPCLRQLYVDRILADQDETRLDDPATKAAVQESIGRYRQLTPKLATKLATQ